jgi:hypothetical protein
MMKVSTMKARLAAATMFACGIFAGCFVDDYQVVVSIVCIIVNWVCLNLILDNIKDAVIEDRKNSHAG